jgi:hypothetical protein
LKVLLLTEGRMSVAVRLDKDMVSQGKDAAQALERLQKTLFAYEVLDARRRLLVRLYERMMGQPLSDWVPLVDHTPPPVVYAKVYRDERSLGRPGSEGVGRADLARR